MKCASVIKKIAWRSCIIALVICGLGCRALSPTAAAVLAAKLANDECERLYKKRPFTAGQHAAVLEGEVYRWGRLDPGGTSGLSAVVIFRADGSHPKVQVYFSTDILFFPKLVLPPSTSPPVPELKRP